MMRKRLLSLATTLIISSSLVCNLLPESIIADFSTVVSAKEPATSGQCGDTAYWQINSNPEGYTLIISGSGAMYDYDYDTTPWDINHYSDRITDIEVKEGITRIGNYAFDRYRENTLTTVNLARSIEEIGESAFEFNYNLKEINLPYHIRSIEDAAFCGTSISNIHFPNGLKSIGLSAFKGCEFNH